MKKYFKFLGAILLIASTVLVSTNLAKADREFSLPDQTGQSGKFLQTDGVNPLWATPGGGGGGAFSDITGTPYEVAYFDASGNGTSDQYFVRDDINFNTTLSTPIDTGMDISLITDFDGGIFGNPGGAFVYQDSVNTITTGLLVNNGGTVGLESSNLVWTDDNISSFISVDSGNASVTWNNAATGYISQFAATDVGMNATNTDPGNGFSQGFGFGSVRAQFNRMDSNLTYNETRLSFEGGEANLRIRDTGGAVTGMQWTMSESDFLISSNESATSFLVDRSAEEIVLTTDATTIDSAQILKRRAVNDTDTNIDLDDYMITGVALTTDRTFDLQAIGAGAAEAPNGQTYVVKNKDDSTADIILTPAGGDTIDGAASLTIIPGQSYTIVSDGSADWEVI